MESRKYFVAAADAAIVRLRLAEAIAWCSSRVSLTNPRDSLRTAELKPTVPLFIERELPDGTLSYEFPNSTARAATVRQGAERRASLLAKDGIPVIHPPKDLAGGRMFVCEIDNSVWDGLSAGECGGFVDDCDIPAWDTWIDLRDADGKDILLCWVPMQLIGLVEAAMAVNCTSCLEWVDELVEERR